MYMCTDVHSHTARLHCAHTNTHTQTYAGEIMIRGSQVAHVITTKGRKHCLQVIAGDKTQYLINFEEAVVEQWIAEIEKVCVLVRVCV